MIVNEWRVPRSPGAVDRVADSADPVSANVDRQAYAT
jgi:hypothetical protein